MRHLQPATPRSMERAFLALWWILAAALFYLSAMTVRNGLSDPHGGSDLHAVIVGCVEAAAAVLFVVPGTMRLGAIGLLGTIAIAEAANTVQGHFSINLVVYAAAVFFVMAHGPVPARRILGEPAGA